MKIIQFMASQRWGGAEKVFVDISNELSRNHRVTALLLRETEYRDKFSQGVEIIELSSNPTTHNPLLVRELYITLRNKRPDIVHTHAVKAAVLMRRVGCFLDFKHLATKHNARKGRVFNHLKWVSVVSREGQRSVKARKNAVIKVICNGILPRETGPARDVDTSGEFRIAAIGRLDAIKGFDILLEQLKGLSFPFKLLIVGEGPERENLRRKALQLNIKKNVHLIGFSDDIHTLMAQSHVVVISSHSEGFPQVMVESLFYGNVLISTPVGGVIEVLPSLFLAEQLELGSKLEDVYRNYGYYRSEFLKLQKDRSQEFLLEKIAADYLSYYEEIIGSV